MCNLGPLKTLIFTSWLWSLLANVFHCFTWCRSSAFTANYVSQYTSIALVQSWHLIPLLKLGFTQWWLTTDTGPNRAELYPDANYKAHIIASIARGKKQKIGAESRNGERSIDEFFTASKWFLLVLVALLAETAYNLYLKRSHFPRLWHARTLFPQQCILSVCQSLHVALNKGLFLPRGIKETLLLLLDQVSQHLWAGIARGHYKSIHLYTRV